MNGREQGQSPLHRDALHESGYRHTSGEARYVDDLPLPPGTLVARAVQSPHARARILSRDGALARAIDGVQAVLFVEDIPGDPMVGPIIHDEPLLARGEVHYVGQPVAVVVATDYEACARGVAAVEIAYEPLPSVLSIQDALAAGDSLTEKHIIARGDVDSALESAAIRVDGEFSNGAQDHFYLETHAALVLPLEDRCYHVYSSTQHPSEVQKLVGSVLGVGGHQVVCEVPRMGGGFGGKESQASQIACMAAISSWHTGRPVKMWLKRDEDMTITGKRHPFWSRYSAGFDASGVLIALQVQLVGDGGWSIDLSAPILDRALFHLDNAYFIENLQFEGHMVRTNTASNTAFRGFGGPQGMLVVEDAINRYCELEGRDPAEVRALNYYTEGTARHITPYGQALSAIRLQRLHDELMESSDYQRRRAQIDHFNQAPGFVKRGIGFQPVKFGISFTKSLLNQAGALVLVYADGTVQLNHGGTEMGQGLHTKMLAVCAHELGVDLDAVRVMHTATDKVPNTSATAASSGSDLNGQAVKAACTTVRARMAPVAAELLGLPASAADGLVFCAGEVSEGASGGKRISFREVATECWVRQISLSSTGFYRTPGVAYDPSIGRGTPFYYFAYGAAVSEVELNTLTGEHRLLRVDIVHDVGTSLVPSVDIGQVEGAFVQGMGWLTMEEVLFSAEGKPLTVGPSTYKIPAVGDTPVEFNVSLLERAPQDGVIHGSKAVGEPPFMLAISVTTALRHAIASLGQGAGLVVNLCPPCTPEALLRAVEDMSLRAADRSSRSAPEAAG